MPRYARLKSPTGVYHVMMRGINRQSIFLDKQDLDKFLYLLNENIHRRNNLSGKKAAEFEIYAYALMGNHFHLLVKVISGELGELIKKIASSYVMYFNKKYNRDGHLFKERYKSEICEYADYFETLLRYIHQNPIKAGICTDLLKCNLTSWAEYADPDSAPYKICNTEFVLDKIPFEKLEQLVYDIMPENVKCIDTDKSRGQITDAAILGRLAEKHALDNPQDLKKADRKMRKAIISDLLDYGASVCQLSRLCGINKATISLIKRSKT